MGAKEKLFRQKLANQIEKLLTKSEVVFGTEKLTNEWLDEMLSESQELITRLTIFKFLHELPEDADLQVEFLEMIDSENEAEPKADIPTYGDEILKEIDEFESSEAIDVVITPEVVPEPIVEPEPEPIIEEIKDIPPVVDEKIIETPVVETPEVAVEVEEAAESEPVVEEVEEIEEAVEEIPVAEEVEELEEVLEEVIEEIVEETPVEESETSAPKEVIEPEDKVREINDAVANTERSLAEKLSAKSIKKLAESIALNERFLYSNELFNGNMEAFKRALNELDHIASLDDAKRYLEVQLKEENNWNMESETVQNFISLVERRFV